MSFQKLHPLQKFRNEEEICTEEKDSNPLNKELLQIMKKLVDLDRKQHKINQILYLNIRFDNLLLILLRLLVNQRVTSHILLGKKLQKLQNL